MNIDEKEVVEEKVVVEEVVHNNSRIKNYIDKPLTRRERKKKQLLDKHYEKSYGKNQFHLRDKRSFRFKILLGLLLTLGVILLFRYILEIDMTVFFDTIKIPAVIASVSLLILSIYLVLSDKTASLSLPDPITDYFLIKRGKVTGRTKKDLENKVNTRFLMVTFLKLYRRQEIAIVNEKIIYGTMESELSLDEITLLNLLLDNQVKTLDDFLDLVDDSKGSELIDKFYESYKNSIIQMAYDKKYINQSINKAKYVLRFGGLVHSLIVLAMLAKGQGSLFLLSIYSIQAVVLFVIANFIYARSKGGNNRISEIRKQKRLLLSPKENLYSSLIYNFMFGKENRILKKIDKHHKDGTMSSKEYAKFSETYNGFNYLLDYLKIGYLK